MCDIASSNPSPIYQDNKKALNKLCLRSVVNAYREVNPYVVFLCDHCGPEYKEIIETICPFNKEIIFTNVGIHENAKMQYDFIKDDDIYLFQECDYLYLPNTGNSMLEAARKFDFISPYDHPDKYDLKEVSEIQLAGDRHWKTTISTTSTFMARREKIMEQLDLFKSYGWEDHKRWVDLGTKGYKLWTPIPAIATHMVANCISPVIDWKKEYDY